MARDRLASASPSKKQSSAGAVGPQLTALLDSLTKVTEPKSGREICAIFAELPSRDDYPDYYDAVESPICLADIRHRLQRLGKAGGYTAATAVQSFRRDIDLMVKNAQTYNRPGSAVYRDASTIQKFVEKGLAALTVPVEDKDEGDEGEAAAMDEDEELEDSDYSRVYLGLLSLTAPGGRRICELFEQLPDKKIYPDYYDVIKTPIAFSQIRAKISADKYGAMDDMERDILQMVDNAKTFNEPASQVHKDSLEIESQFYKMAGLDREKSKFNQPLDEFFIRKQRFEVGDFVLINLRDKGDDDSETGADDPKPSVGIIYRIWKNLRGQSTFSANIFLRPEQTVHPAGRKFYKNEVFKSNVFEEHTASAVAGRCLVMPVKEFARGRPYGLSKDVPIFVCESRYAAKRTAPVKEWKLCLPEAVRDDEPAPLVPFDRPLVVEKTEPSPFLPANAIPPPTKNRRQSEQPLDKNSRMSIDSNSDSNSDSDTSDDDNDGKSRHKRARKRSHTPRRSVSKQPPSVTAPSTTVTSINITQKAANTPRQPLFNIAALNAVGTGAVPASMKPSSSAETLPDETVEQFRTRDGKIVWCAAPPLKIVRKPAAAVHSLEYLHFKARQAASQDSATTATAEPASVIAATSVSAVPVAPARNQQIPAVLQALTDCAAEMQRDARTLQQQLLTLH